MKPSLIYMPTWIILFLCRGTLDPSFEVRAMGEFYTDSYNVRENFAIQ